jgi:protease-4
MKNETFIVIQDFRKKVIKWRVLAFIGIFLTIISSSGNVVQSKKNQNIIARVKISGILINNLSSKKKLKELDSDNIKAVILDIDSPGGDVVESEMLYTFFRNLSKKKPIVSIINGVGASGAYIVAMASDYIIAYNTSAVGSIGVLVQSYELTELAKKIGISLTTYKSSPLKSAPNPYEKITPDVDMVVSQEIDDVYDYFLSIFIERRRIKITEAQEIANGQIYTGRQALEFGLIDKIGGEDELLNYFKDINLDVSKMNFVDFNIYKNESGLDFIGNLLSSVKKSGEISSRVMAIYNR